MTDLSNPLIPGPIRCSTDNERIVGEDTCNDIANLMDNIDGVMQDVDTLSNALRQCQEDIRNGGIEDSEGKIEEMKKANLLQTQQIAILKDAIKFANARISALRNKAVIPVYEPIQRNEVVMEGTQTPVMVAQRVGSKQTKKRAVEQVPSNTTTAEGTGTTTLRVNPPRESKTKANVKITGKPRPQV